MSRLNSFTACANCGSLDLRGISNTEGPVGFAADLAIYKCRECGWQGGAIEFEDEASWRAFLAAKRGAGP